jgi:phenylpropionate dioxygenase-like ring-hydroxylating dioxygenase large terminal subunit
MFLYNNWYVAAFSSEVVTGTPLARRILNQPVALFRTASGAVAALEDRCIHRGMPLAEGGECEGEIIRCPYHGLEYDGTGACTKIPGQDAVPAAAAIRSYPIVERYELLWIWTGDPRLASDARIPVHPWHTDPAWAYSKILIEVAADWQLFNDNLLDLSHLGLVHKRTIGGDPDTHSNAEMTTTRDGNTVAVRRWLLNSNPPPFYKNAGGFTSTIDRWQEIDFRPGLLEFYTGATAAGTGAYEGRREGGVHIRHLHGITPETEHSTHYFFTQARNFAVDDAALTDRLAELARVTFLEDKAVLEAQQARLLEEPKKATLDIRSDAAGIHARRIVAELYDAEQRSREPVAAGR